MAEEDKPDDKEESDVAADDNASDAESTGDESSQADDSAADEGNGTADDEASKGDEESSDGDQSTEDDEPADAESSDDDSADDAGSGEDDDSEDAAGSSEDSSDATDSSVEADGGDSDPDASSDEDGESDDADASDAEEAGDDGASADADSELPTDDSTSEVRLRKIFQTGKKFLAARQFQHAATEHVGLLEADPDRGEIDAERAVMVLSRAYEYEAEIASGKSAEAPQWILPEAVDNPIALVRVLLRLREHVQETDPARRDGILGVAAIFRHPNHLLYAAEQVRDSHYERFDALSPFPIHGMDDALGLGRSWIPWVTFAAACAGFTTACTLEFGIMAFDWPMNYGGKPFASWPAFVPIIFELTVLFAGVTTAVVMLIAAGCFRSKPMIDEEITKDHFVLWVDGEDDRFNREEVIEFMKDLNPLEIRTLRHEGK